MENKISLLLICFLGMMYSTSAFAQETNSSNSTTVQKSKEETRYAIGLGYARRVGELLKTGDSQMDALSKDIQNGFYIDAEMQLFFKEVGSRPLCKLCNSKCKKSHL